MSSLKDILKYDVSFAYAELGSLVVYGAYTSYGIMINEPIEVIELGGKHSAIQNTTLTLMFAADSIGPIKNNTSIVVDSKQYTITKFINLDAYQTKVWLVGRV